MAVWSAQMGREEFILHLWALPALSRVQRLGFALGALGQRLGTRGHLCPVLPLPPSSTALTPGDKEPLPGCQKATRAPRAPEKTAEPSLVFSTYPCLHENSLKMEPELLLEANCAFLRLFAFVFLSWKLLFWLCLRAAGKLLELVWQFSQSFVEKGESTTKNALAFQLHK